MPVFDLVETCLRGCEITGFDGILTGVTNYILGALRWTHLSSAVV